MAWKAGLMAMLALILGWVAACQQQAQENGSRLQSIEDSMARRFDKIGHMTTQDLAARMASGTKIVLLDAREPEEYAVGFIPSAIRVDPGASSREVMALVGDAAQGADVVVYCSVGVRSSKIAERARPALAEAGATGVYNLRGGVFAWHNEGRGLENAGGSTALVHPYDSHWGKLLTRQDAVAMQPGG